MHRYNHMLATAAVSHKRKASTAAAAGNAWESAVERVWGLPPTPAGQGPLVHIMQSVGPPGQWTVANIVPLTLAGTHPSTFEKKGFSQFLAKNMLSRSAKSSGCQAAILSASYLPSQLRAMADVAAKQSLGTQVLISGSEPAQQHMHVMFYSIPVEALGQDLDEGAFGRLQQQTAEGLRTALQDSGTAAFTAPLQPVTDPQLDAAAATEHNLQRQLQLFDAATWNSIIQQRLMAKKVPTYYLAVRSLMNPPQLAAAQQLVERVGLHWLQLPADEVPAAAVAAPASSDGSNDGNSKAGSRRRLRHGSSGSTAAAAEAPAGSSSEAGLDGTVVIISTVPMDAEAATTVQEQHFTDYQPGSNGSAMDQDEQPQGPGGGSGGGLGWAAGMRGMFTSRPASSV